jgi:hypothetical protein
MLLERYPHRMPNSGNRERKRTVNWYGLPKTRVPGYRKKPIEEQIGLFSKVVMANRGKPIHRVWSQLDDVGRSVVMKELGCFAGENAPQVIYAQRDQCAREFLVEAKRQSRWLSRFISRQAKHERTISALGFPPGSLQLTAQKGLGPLSSVIAKEEACLQEFSAHVKRRLIQRGNWDPERMIKAQEYVSRRLKFLGAPGSIRLTPEAIAEVFELTQALANGSAAEISENIRKAIAYFRKNPANKELLDNIERVIPDWTFPVELAKTGNSASKKRGS